MYDIQNINPAFQWCMYSGGMCLSSINENYLSALAKKQTITFMIEQM